MRIKSFITVLAGLLLLVPSCTKTSVVEEYEETKDSNDPMQFSTASEDLQHASTKASLLQDGFVVSCWKKVGTTDEQTVMDDYQVKYKSDDWNNTSKWEYVTGHDGLSFYKDQPERYWDYAGFPYQFCAVSPAAVNASETGLIAGFSMTSTSLTIPTTVEYRHQTYVGGVVSAGAEPYLVAQVRRSTDGKDTDVLTTSTDKEINKNSGNTLNRRVALPFHHLTSKIRIGIYTSDLGALSDAIPVKNLVLKVVSPSFATAASGFTSSWTMSQGSMTEGNFTTFTRSTASEVLLASTVGTDIEGDVSKSTKPSNAFFFGCPDGMLQIPQTGVRLTVSFDIEAQMVDELTLDANSNITYEEATHTTHYKDIPVIAKMDDDTDVTSYDWKPGFIYTYNIIVNRFSMHPFEFTATVNAWENVTGSLETDLEK